MTRDEFMHKIDNITEMDLINAFHDYMVLYNLYSDICRSDNVNISKSSEPGSFDMVFVHPSHAEKTYSTFNGAHVNIYGIVYSINCVLDDNLLHIHLIAKLPDMD